MRYVNVLCRDGLRRTIAKTTATKMTPAHLSALADTYAMQAVAAPWLGWWTGFGSVGGPVSWSSFAKTLDKSVNIGYTVDIDTHTVLRSLKMTPKSQIEKLERELARQVELVGLAEQLAPYHPIFAHPRTLYYSHKPIVGDNYHGIGVTVADDHAAALLLKAFDVQTGAKWDYKDGNWRPLFAPWDHGYAKLGTEVRPCVAVAKASWQSGRVCLVEIRVFIHVGVIPVALTIRIEDTALWPKYLRDWRSRDEQKYGPQTLELNKEWATLDALLATLAPKE